MTTMQPKMIFRDLGVLSLAAVAWWADGVLHGGGGALSWIIAALAGLLAGVVGYYVHEWGHLLGARWSGAAVRFPDRLTAPLLFDFDVDTSTRRQFLAMSFGGYAGSAVGLVALLLLVPLDRLSGWVALGALGLGVLATLVLEAPTTYRVARGAPPPRALIEVAPRDAAGSPGGE